MAMQTTCEVNGHRLMNRVISSRLAFLAMASSIFSVSRKRYSCCASSNSFERQRGGFDVENECGHKWCGTWCPRPELNWDQRFRKPLLYPFELRGQCELIAFVRQNNFACEIVISKRAKANRHRFLAAHGRRRIGDSQPGLDQFEVVLDLSNLRFPFPFGGLSHPCPAPTI